MQKASTTKDRADGGDGVDAALAAHAVAMVTGYAVKALARSHLRDPGLKRAQRMVWYLAHTTYGWPHRRVAQAFGIDHRAVARACLWVEDDRDEPLVDAVLTGLDGLLRGLLDNRDALAGR